MARDSIKQRRAVSLLFVFGSILLLVAAWNLPENAPNGSYQAEVSD